MCAFVGDSMVLWLHGNTKAASANEQNVKPPGMIEFIPAKSVRQEKWNMTNHEAVRCCQHQPISCNVKYMRNLREGQKPYRLTDANDDDDDDHVDSKKYDFDRWKINTTYDDSWANISTSAIDLSSA